MQRSIIYLVTMAIWFCRTLVILPTNPAINFKQDHASLSPLHDEELETASATAQPCQDTRHHQARTGMEEEAGLGLQEKITGKSVV